MVRSAWSKVMHTWWVEEGSELGPGPAQSPGDSPCVGEAHGVQSHGQEQSAAGVEGVGGVGVRGVVSDHAVQPTQGPARA